MSELSFQFLVFQFQFLFFYQLGKYQNSGPVRTKSIVSALYFHSCSSLESCLLCWVAPGLFYPKSTNVCMYIDASGHASVTARPMTGAKPGASKLTRWCQIWGVETDALAVAVSGDSQKLGRFSGILIYRWTSNGCFIFIYMLCNWGKLYVVFGQWSLKHVVQVTST